LAARRRLGYLPEQPYFYPHLKGRELVEYFGRLFGLRGASLRSKAEQLLAMVGLADDGEKLIGQYSKGMLQRLGVAQALVNDPDLVIFDEPMSGLDPIGRREVKDLIMSVKERGATVFFSSHILQDAEALCDRVGLIVNGKMRFERNVDDLLDEQVDYWEAASEGLAAGALAYEPVATQGDLSFYRLDDEPQVDAWVDAVRGAGGRVYRVAPRRTTLEDYFMVSVQETGDSTEIDAAAAGLTRPASAAGQGSEEGEQ
jgi:ABC-2 type transport system ATP-binding protein